MAKRYLYIFDMGGVVSEHCYVWKHICEAMQLPPPETRDSRGDFSRLEGAVLRGDITSMEMLTLVAGRTGCPVPKENYWKTFFTPTLHEPTVALIRDLKAKGNRVICGTNTIDVHYAAHAECGQYDIFDAVYASHLMGKIKPESAFFESIREAEKNWQFSDMFFFDDMQKNADAAARLGIHAHCFTTAQAARTFIQQVTGEPV